MNFLRSRRASADVGRRRPIHVDEVVHTSSSEIDGPLQPKKSEGNKDMTKDMPPDKQLEERVLLEYSEYLAENLPADDVAPKMLSSNLLTCKEHDEYRALKRSFRSTIDLSYYLLECLRKRHAGFLGTFCNILWEIQPANYLGDHIQEAYNAAVTQGGFNPGSRDRLSKMSCSDTDISMKAAPQVGVSQPCVACKVLRKQNRQLKEQLIDLDKECHLLYNAKIKIETQLETLQDQLQREERERQNLSSTLIVPKLQEVITLIESRNRTTEPSGAQQTLKRMSDLMHEQVRPDVPKRKFHSSFGYSMLSLFSDTSSVAGEEETARQNATASDTNSIPAITHHVNDSDKSVPIANTQKDKPIMTPAVDRHTEIPNPEADRERTPFQTQEDIIAKEQPHKPIRCDSTPESDWNKTHSAPARKTRHHSVSGATENSTKPIHEDLSHSLIRGRKLTYPTAKGSQAYLQGDELQSRLAQRRKRIEASCEAVEK